MSMQQENVTMALRASAFASRSSGASQVDTVDKSGSAILALLDRAADAAKEDCQRALEMAHQLSLQLRAAEDRIIKLEVKVKQLENDAHKAEDWLTYIQKEIENKFLNQKDVRSQQL
jgi:hypothetical protein